MIRIPKPAIEEATVSLIPIMNLFSSLIPFLLLSAAFFHLSMIKVTVPVTSSTTEAVLPESADATNLTLRIRPSVFELYAVSSTSPAGTSAPILVARRLDNKRRRDETYAQLRTAARAVKEKQPTTETVLIIPDPFIPYEQVIDCMDAVRETAASLRLNRGAVALFPRVVLSAPAP